MALSSLTRLLLWFAMVPIALAVSSGAALRTYGRASENKGEVIDTLKTAFHHAAIHARDTVYSMNRTSLEKSWSDATLFKFGESSSHNTSGVTSLSTSGGTSRSSLDLDASIAIVCSTCYINGSVAGSLTLNGDFNATQAKDNLANDIKNVTTAAFNELKNFTKEVAHDIAEDITTLELHQLPAFPTLDLDLNLKNVTNFEGAQVRFEFDNLELYLDIDVILSAGATYTLTIFQSESEAGFAVPGLEVGAVFSVELILIAEADIKIGSGFHIKLDEGLIFDLEVFDGQVSSITIPGGQYEVLPVTIEGEGTINALLNLKATLGVQVSDDSLGPDFKLSSGIQADVFAYVSDFLLKANATSDPSDGECEISAVAEYTVALGAAAGATVAVDTFSWGPSPETTVPVFYTTLASICATNKVSAAPSPSITPRGLLDSRESSTTTILTSTESYTIVNCLSAGLVHCPVNLQNTTSYEQVLTTQIAVPSGSSPTWPASTYASVTSAVPFGKQAKKLAATSGTPTSFVPPPATSSPTSTSSSNDDSGVLDGKTNGTSNKLIIGLSVGLGVPALIAIIWGLSWFIFKRNRYDAVPSNLTTPYVGADSPPTASAPLMGEAQKVSPKVALTEH